MSKMIKNKFLFVLLGILGLCLAAALFYSLPPVHERLAWRVETLRVRVLRILKPPEEQVFVPHGRTTEPATWPAATSTTLPAPQHFSGTRQTATEVSAVLIPTETPTPAATATLPAGVNLSGVTHEYQQFNNCGPATLAMALSFWGWQGDQRDTRLALRPNFAAVDDKNVNPAEMVAFSESQAGFKAISGVGGETDTLKRLLAAGYPVVIEIGIQQHAKDWMGHYLLLTGYDEEQGRFITQDSLIGANLPRDYSEIEAGWRAFNQVYLVVFPQEKEAEVRGILGAQADPQDNLRSAVMKNQQALGLLDGAASASSLERYFAWYNLGSSLTALGDYPGAAQAYDQAFQIYASIPEDDRPWRMLWYQSGPYEAYYQTGRYQDVITLGNQALDSAGGPVLEEAFYWLGRAREATGDLAKAVYDYQKAVEINPFSTPAKQELERLGISG